MQFNSSKLRKDILLWLVNTVLVSLIITGNCVAQKIPDTVSLAKKLRNEGRPKAAFRLLNQYSKNHPQDFNTTWFTAQTAYWANKVQTADLLYKKLVQENPANYYLQLDYAKMLVDIGAFDKAVPILNKYLLYDLKNTDALITLAKIDYWRGNYKAAFDKIAKLLKQDPHNNAAIKLKEDILLSMSPWLKLDIAYDTDDQPFQKFISSLEGGLFLHPLANLHFTIASPFFIRDGNTDNAISFQLGNTSDFHKQGIVTEINAGFTKFPFQNTIRFTGAAGVTKTFVKNLTVNVAASRRPYFYSRKSIDTILIEDNIAIAAGWNNQHTINGNAGFSSSHFPDKNTVSSFYATLYSPTFKISACNFQFGYSYNYSNAKQNNFVPEKSVSEIIASSDNNISGLYNPYFTPYDQQVHAVIAAINYQPQKKLVVGASANYGFYATTKNPYFGLITQNNIITGVGKDYAEEKFSPVQAGAYLLLQATKKTSLKVSYQFHHTFFYTDHNVILSLKTSFWNEKK